MLLLIHLPIALRILVGMAYVGGRWRGNERRMDFIRFTGEAFISLLERSFVPMSVFHQVCMAME